MKPQTQNPLRTENILIPRLILALALWLVGGVIAYTMYREDGHIEKRERERLSTQAKVIEENLAVQLEGIYLALEGIRRELPLWEGEGDIEHASSHLRAMADAVPCISTFLITDSAGTITASNSTEVIGKNFRHREYFKAPLKDHNLSTLYISPPFKTMLGGFAINLTLSIPGPEGEFAGVISASLDPEYFRTLLGSVLYAPDMWTALAHGDGQQFLMVPDRNGMSGMDLAKPGTFFTRHRESALPATVMAGRAYATGEERLVAMRTVKPGKVPMDKPLVVAVGREMPALYADWRREAIGKTSLFGLLVLATALTLYLYQQRQRKFDAASARYEEMRRDSAERLKLATEAAGVGVWDQDLENGCLTWDDAMFSIYQLEPAAFSSVYHDWRDTVLPEDLNGTEAALQATINGGEPINTSFRIRRGDGEVRTIRAMARVHYNRDGKPVRVIGINEDVTERQQEAEALRKSERFLKTLTNAIPGMAAYWDKELRCTFANNEYWTWFGKTPAGMVGIQIEELLGEELFRQNEPFIRNVLKGEAQHFERIMTKANGEVGHTWVHYIPDIDCQMVRGFYVLISEITELKQAHLQLEEMNLVLKQRTEEAERANRSKSRFLARIAHEFRTPLSLLTSSTDILDRYAERLSQEQRTDQNGHIRNAARQMAGLIDAVLSFSRQELERPEMVPELLDVGRICRTIAAEATTVWGAGHDFRVTIPADCGSAMLDETLFRRVLENLLGNAFRYTPKGGAVSLRVSREEARLQLVICDSGIGIAQEELKQVFESFYRGSNVEGRRGLGLGLPIVHEALSQMGGTITVDSTLGKGTAMRVQIPLTD